MIRWRSVQRLLAAAAAVIAVVVLLAAAGVWLLTHAEIRRLRAVAEEAPPVPPRLAAAIVAAEDPILLERPPISLRALLPPREGVVRCGPSPIAVRLVRSGTLPRRSWRRHLETGLVAYAVAWNFTAEEQLRIYAHELYLGTVDGRQILGVEAASRRYFAKEARDLTQEEAAMIAAMIRAPNVFSPLRNRQRAIERRDKVLAKMRRTTPAHD